MPRPSFAGYRIRSGGSAPYAVMDAEVALNNHPHDVSRDNLGYDIESLDPRTGRLRFIEVKGRRAGASTVAVTKNEILAGINSADQFILALVEVEDGQAKPPRYVQRPFDQEPGFGVTSVNFDLKKPLSKSMMPEAGTIVHRRSGCKVLSISCRR